MFIARRSTVVPRATSGQPGVSRSGDDPPPPRSTSNYTNRQDRLKIFEAVKKGSADDVRRELRELRNVDSVQHINAQSEFVGLSALHQAAQDGHVEIAQLLINSKHELENHSHHHPDAIINLNLGDKDLQTPLHKAALKGHTAVLEVLLEAGADAAAKMRGGRTPYDCAQLLQNEGCAACADALLQHYVDKLWDKHAEQALHALLLEATFRPSDYPAHQPGNANLVQLPIGKLQVHDFCHGVVRRLLRASSRRVLQARRRDRGQRGHQHQYQDDWPVHTASRRHAPPAVLEYLVEQDPDSCTATTRKGWLPLHLACSNSSSSNNNNNNNNNHGNNNNNPAPDDAHTDVIEFWHRRAPASIRTPTIPAGNLPLHIACRNGAPLAVIQTLTRLHRAALYARNDRGSLPLHVACHSSAALDVLQFLVRESLAYANNRNTRIAVNALRTPDGTGALPLHLACRSGFPVQPVVELLVQQGGPETVRVRDAKGALPLHYLLCRSLVPGAAVELLLRYHPGAVAEWTASGYPPFLLAAGHNAPLDVIQSLVRGYLGWNADLSLGNNNFVATTTATTTTTANNNNNNAVDGSTVMEETERQLASLGLEDGGAALNE